MSWAIGAGYMGLYSSNIKKQTSKEEFDVLKSLRKDIELEKEKNIQADLQEQQYYENISKFAENLLEEDRNAINRKARQMASSVREHIRSTGGNMRKFFENGGHKMLGDYRSSIINSAEASAYIENKKNMEKILDLQQKGLGHLINPRDLYNLQQRQKNGTGIITYSGMLNEINIDEMAKDYAYGQYIPAEDILNKHYMKILGNYQATYDVKEQPSRDDLLAYVHATFGERKGTNSNINQALFQQNFQIKNAEYNADVRNADTRYKIGQDNFTNKIRANEENRAQETHEMNRQKHEMSIIEHYNKYAFRGDENGNPNISEDGKTITVKNKNGEDVVLSVKDLQGAGDFHMKFSLFRENILSEKISAVDFSDKSTSGFDEVGGVWTPYREASLADESWNISGFLGTGTFYTPAGARVIMKGSALSNLIKNNEKHLPLKIKENGKIDGKTLREESGIFSSNGIALENSGGDFIKDNIQYEITGVITAAEVELENGHKRIVMNQTNKTGTIDERKNEAFKRKTYGDRKVTDTPVYLTLKGEDGRIIYKKLDDDNSNKFIGQGGIEHHKARAIAYNKVKQSKQDKVDVKQLHYENMSRNRGLTPQGAKIANQGEVIFGTTGSSKYDDLMFSFYMSLYPERENLNNINTAINKNTLSVMIQSRINEFPDTGVELEKLRKRIKNGEVSSEEIIDFFEENKIVPKSTANYWRNNYRTIKFN